MSEVLSISGAVINKEGVTGTNLARQMAERAKRYVSESSGPGETAIGCTVVALVAPVAGGVLAGTATSFVAEQRLFNRALQSQNLQRVCIDKSHVEDFAAFVGSGAIRILEFDEVTFEGRSIEMADGQRAIALPMDGTGRLEKLVFERSTGRVQISPDAESRLQELTFDDHTPKAELSWLSRFPVELRTFSVRNRPALSWESHIPWKESNVTAGWKHSDLRRLSENGGDRVVWESGRLQGLTLGSSQMFPAGLLRTCSLHRIVIAGCSVPSMEMLFQSSTVEEVVLEKSSLGDDPTVLSSTGNAKSLVLDSNDGAFRLNLAAGQSLLQNLEILGHRKPLDDTWIQALPGSLRRFVMKGENRFTVGLIQRLPQDGTLSFLKMKPVEIDRLRLVRSFPRCDIKTSEPPTLEEVFGQRVLEQPEVADEMASAIGRLALGRRGRSGPREILFLVGPSGVGKTETAIAMGDILDRPVLRFAMGTYGSEHDLGRLVGFAPSYREAKGSGEFLNDVYKHPNAVVLLDEFEKSHLKVKLALLEMLETGKMTHPGHQRDVDFTNTIVIMTSNLGADRIVRALKSGSDDPYGDAVRIGETLLAQAATDAYTSRVKHVIPYRQLSAGAARIILEAKLETCVEEWAKPVSDEGLGMTIDVDPGVVDHLMGRYTPEFGARKLVNAFVDLVEGAIGRLRRHIGPGDSVCVRMAGSTQMVIALADGSQQWPVTVR